MTGRMQAVVGVVVAAIGVSPASAVVDTVRTYDENAVQTNQVDVSARR